MRLHEGDKTRFLKPMFDTYNTNGTILFDDLVKWVNDVGQNKFTYNWLDKDKEGLYNNIVNDYQAYKDMGGSRKERKRDVIAYAESHGLKFLAQNDKYYFFWVPSYEAAKWCDSFDCAGFGGKWCIGWRESDQYWQSYTGRGDKFILALNKRPKNAQDGKMMIELAPVGATGGARPQIWFQTDKPNETMPWNKWKQSIGYSYPELRKLVSRAEAGEDLKEGVIDMGDWDALFEQVHKKGKETSVSAWKHGTERFVKDAYKKLGEDVNELILSIHPKAKVLCEGGRFEAKVRKSVYEFLDNGGTTREEYFRSNYKEILTEAEDYFLAKNKE